MDVAALAFGISAFCLEVPVLLNGTMTGTCREHYRVSRVDRDLLAGRAAIMMILDPSAKQITS
jgi:hypothetical protein